ncbi:hypothetical protein WG908_03220 [Sphingobium sp. AN641]|uniref:hypothetical protein n=1 Tax=Sphingobium sp. AN641 TaxID=3133443 RepID=UPI0030BCF7BD
MTVKSSRHLTTASRRGAKTQKVDRRPIRVSDEDEGEWDSARERVRQMIRLAPGKGKGVSPYDNTDNVQKREAYRLTRKYLKRRNAKIIENLLINRGDAPKRIKFKDNPFYWVLILLDLFNRDNDRGNLSKTARILLYAHHHDIDPDLVVGFLHQCGTPASICKKAAVGELEPWFAKRREELDW